MRQKVIANSYGRPTLIAAAAAAISVTGLTACSSEPSSQAPDNTITVVATVNGCAPQPSSAPAGPLTFKASNTGTTDISEVELIQGGKILGETASLRPGESASFSLDVSAGSYEIFCPGTTQSRTPFTVTTGAANAQSTCSPAVRKALAEPTTRYHDYVVGQVELLSEKASVFTDAVRAGDVAAAKAAFAEARYNYETIEPVAESFGDLDPKIDARVNDLEPGHVWTGFHRIEKALWVDGSTRGMTKFANQLDKHVGQLKKLVATESYQPAQLANGATELLGEVGKSKVTGEEDRYSHTDLSDIAANVAGARQSWNLLGSAVSQLNPALAAEINQRFGTLARSVDAYKLADGSYTNYARILPAQRRDLAQQVDATAEPLSQVAAFVSSC